LEFLNLIIDHLTERGVMKPSALYESPFTDLNPLGISGVFGAENPAGLIRFWKPFATALLPSHNIRA
jgi:type I restriction enzyme R subunit